MAAISATALPMSFCATVQPFPDRLHHAEALVCALREANFREDKSAASGSLARPGVKSPFGCYQRC